MVVRTGIQAISRHNSKGIGASTKKKTLGAETMEPKPLGIGRLEERSVYMIVEAA